jgi:single-stranded-DNA-specific exonuclease
VPATEHELTAVLMGQQLRFSLEVPSPSGSSFHTDSLPGKSTLFPPAAERTLELRTVPKSDRDSVLKSLGLGSTHAAKAAATIVSSRRVHDSSELVPFVSPRLADLPDPSRFKGFDIGVETIIRGINAGERIGIIGDYDVDGITAVAQFVQTLQLTSTPHQYWIPNRFKDGYGISARIVDELIASGTRVAVLFDNGTHAHEHIAKLRAHGIEVLVFDHHTVGDSLPDCILVNPRQKDCGLYHEYPSASGLSALLNQRLRERLGLPYGDLSLACLGTLADMVPLEGLNRPLASIGLKDIRRNANIGISALARRYWVAHDDITSSDIGFLIGPAINAAGRLGDGSAGYDGALCVELLTSSDPDRAKAIADTLFQVNQERKERQRALLLHNYTRLGTLETIPPVLVSFDESHHPGLNGLIAQGLASRYARPAFVFSRNPDGTYTGSARNGHESFDLMQVLEWARSHDTSGVISRCGGHKPAAGVSIRADGLSEFERLVTAAFGHLYPEPASQVKVFADIKTTLRDLTPAFVSQVDTLLEPYGQGFSAPQYLLDELTVRRIEEYGGGRYMIELTQSSSKRTMRAFLGPEIWNSDIVPGCTLTLIATPAQIYRNQKRYVQLSVSGYTVVALPPAPSVPSVDELATPQPPLQLLHVAPAIQADKTSDEAQDLPLEVLEHLRDTHETTVHSTPFQVTRPKKESRFNILKRRLEKAAADFDGRYIYPELEGLQPDFFRPRTADEESRLWNRLIERCDLAINSDGLEYRPWCEEFIRYFFDNSGNHLLQAPTGSGKSEIALSIASHYRKRSRRVIMIAPTIDIVRQLSGRIKRLLNEDAIILDGGNTPPEMRRALYRLNPGFIVATPDVVANDLKNGAISFSAEDLLIVDEAHHAQGKASVVATIKAARTSCARILGLSATPAQVLAGSSWLKLDQLTTTFGVDSIFPLNVPMHRPDIRKKHFELTSEMLKVEALLAEAARPLRSLTLTYFQDHELHELSTLAVKLYGTTQHLFPSPFQLRPLLKALRELPGFADWQTYHSIKAIGELSELRQAVVRQGITSFLLRCTEKRFELSFPTTMRKGCTQPSVRAHLPPVYSSRDVESAYTLLARGAAIPLWSHHEHARIMALEETIQWEALSPSERRSRFTKAVSQIRRRVAKDLESRDFCNHPKEQYLLEALGQHNKPAFVSTRLVDHAMFLTQRIHHHVSSRTASVVTLTGLGTGTRKGVSRTDRERNLASFNAGDASVIVATSAGNEGVDLVADYGYALDFDGSQTSARQKEGRVGRRSFGVFEYLCTTPEDHAKVNNILHKDIRFQEMLNVARAKVTAKAGLPPLTKAATSIPSKKPTTGWLF